MRLSARRMHAIENQKAPQKVSTRQVDAAGIEPASPNALCAPISRACDAPSPLPPANVRIDDHDAPMSDILRPKMFFSCAGRRRKKAPEKVSLAPKRAVGLEPTDRLDDARACGCSPPHAAQFYGICDPPGITPGIVVVCQRVTERSPLRLTDTDYASEAPFGGIWRDAIIISCRSHLLRGYPPHSHRRTGLRCEYPNHRPSCGCAGFAYPRPRIQPHASGNAQARE